jgi:hypothetical protein
MTGGRDVLHDVESGKCMSLCVHRKREKECCKVSEDREREEEML